MPILCKPPAIEDWKVLPVDRSTLEQALNLDYRDFKVAVQMISAMQSKMNCLPTRDIKDYQPPSRLNIKSADFLSTLS